MTDNDPYYSHLLSWLAFNERVLQEARDETNPIIERVRFLGIFSNNQDEFFRVRVADLQRQVEHEGDSAKAAETIKLLRAIQRKVSNLSEQFDQIYDAISKELEKRNVYHLNDKQLTEKQGLWLRSYFRQNILPQMVPILISEKIDLNSRISDGDSYLVVEIKKGRDLQFALLDIPTRISRFLQIPADRSKIRRYYMMVDDAIRYCLDDLFSGFFDYDRLRCWSMKISRDADYALDSDLETSLVEKMAIGMKQRMTSEPVRLSYDKSMPKSVRDMLAKNLGFNEFDSQLAGGPYRNFRDFIGFPNMGPWYLENRALPALQNNQFARHRTVFDAIDEGDILLYYPYHQFNHFSEFIRQAATDPKVREIRINIYRAAKNSIIIDSLIDAARNGKKVVANIELQARFDEEHNIEITEALSDAGIKVTLGIPTLKVHSKLCLVVREVEGKSQIYSHIGTGNFNEKTARIYTDFSLFTAHKGIGQEVRNVFSYIEFSYRHFDFHHLMVSPVNARNQLISLIRSERELAAQGYPAQISLKVNNLADKELIDELYSASQEGVEIRVIVRGMCSLKAGVPGLSENIVVTSIVDRFLEHARVMVFHNLGDQKVFISSADWMSRNIDWRVEVGCPIYDEQVKKVILDILEIQFMDTTKARVIDADQSNEYLKRGNRRKVRSQTAIYDYLRRLEKG